MSAQIDDGGAAFPLYLPQDEGDIRLGMTLHDWFAGQALAGLMVRYDEHPHSIKVCAGLAADAADAMITELKGGKRYDPARASALARMQAPPSANVDLMLTTGSLLCLLRLATTESGMLRHSDITGRSLGARRDELQALCERGLADESAAGYTITDDGNALVRAMLTFAAKGGASDED